MTDVRSDPKNFVLLALMFAWFLIYIYLKKDSPHDSESMLIISFWCAVSFYIWMKFSSYQDAKVAVLFFPDEKSPCFSFYNGLMDKPRSSTVCRTVNCRYLHRDDTHSSLMKIFLALNEAESKIDLCMYLITYDHLADFLIYLHKRRRVRVRIITDSKNDALRVNNQADSLQVAGIEVRAASQINGALMHNKFVIIDNKKLLQGSFNWTKNAVRRNDECVFVHSNKWVVSKLSSKFEKMWAQRKGC